MAIKLRGGIEGQSRSGRDGTTFRARCEVRGPTSRAHIGGRGRRSGISGPRSARSGTGRDFGFWIFDFGFWIGRAKSPVGGRDRSERGEQGPRRLLPFLFCLVPARVAASPRRSSAAVCCSLFPAGRTTRLARLSPPYFLLLCRRSGGVIFRRKTRLIRRGRAEMAARRRRKMTCLTASNRFAYDAYAFGTLVCRPRRLGAASNHATRGRNAFSGFRLGIRQSHGCPQKTTFSLSFSHSTQPQRGQAHSVGVLSSVSDPGSKPYGLSQLRLLPRSNARRDQGIARRRNSLPCGLR
jgi:hypothetical protein